MESGHRPDQSESHERSVDRTTRPDLPDLGDSRYVIQELVGEGGMGYVYRAIDRQLDRTVAIKAIRPALASKPDVVKRLAREAKFAAQLDHPFICKVHELIQRADGQALLVMEYVEGETLKAVLKTVPLDLSSVVRLARELADALGFAHQRGLLHRDIKPANVIMTLPGHIKVMDFGVAKALDVDLSTTSTLTDHGHVVGTPAYMSPEQAAGEPLDHRSDIFSFGVLLYECISGQLPFEGPSAAAYLRQAALSQPKPLPKHVPAELRAIVMRCLAKAPADRYENFDAVRKELDVASLSLISATSDLTFTQRLKLGPKPWVVVAVIVAAVIGGYLLVDWLRPREEVAGGAIAQEAVVTWPSVEDGSRISPDGTKVAFTSNQGGGFRLWIRSATGNEPRAITNAYEAIKTPAWAPDSQRIAYLFRTDGRAWLQIVSIWGESAGPPQPVGGAWDEVALVRWLGQRIYFGLSAGGTASTLWRHDVGSSTNEQLTHPSGLQFSVSGQTVNIDVRRDEQRVLFAGEAPDGGVWTADLDGRRATRLPIPASAVITPRWRGLDGSRIVYVANENGQIDAWEYNINTKRRTPLTTSPLEEEAIDVSESGSVMVADTIEQVSHLWALDLDTAAAAAQLTNDSRSDLWPSIASSGKVVFHRRRGSFVVYTPDDTEIATADWTADHRLQTGPVLGAGATGSISPDGRRVFFLRWTEASHEYAEFWVRDLTSLNAGRMLWNRFWFPGNQVDTWAPLGQSATWGPRGSDELFFARRADSADVSIELVRATLAADLSAKVQVLATTRDQGRFTDLAVSDDASSVAYVAATRRPHRGGTVQILDLRRPEAGPTTVFQATEKDGAQLYVRGWTRRGTIVVLKSLRPDRENTTEIWEVHPRGSTQRVAVIPGSLGMTSRFDSARDRLFATVIEKGHASVRAVSLPSGAQRTIVPNAVDGVTFAGYGVAPDGWLLYMRKDTNKDVWLFNFAGRRSGSASTGDNK